MADHDQVGGSDDLLDVRVLPSQRSTLNAAGSPTCMRAGARSWMADLVEGRVNSFEEIARSENKVERHIPDLAPLAVSPRIVEASHCQR